MTLKILTFNTQHCLNYVTRRIDFDIMAKTVRDSGADIVGLQEIRGEGELRGEYEAQTSILADQLGFYGYFAEAIRFGGVNPYGNALLSRYPICRAETVLIPDPEPRGYNGYYETRCVLRAVIELPGTAGDNAAGAPERDNAAGVPEGDNGSRELNVLISHFGLNPDEQVNAVETVKALLPDRRGVLMGDFNVRPDAPVLAPLRARLFDTAEKLPASDAGLTFPSDRPDRKIDYIFTTPELTVRSAKAVETVASDHRPFLAVLDV